MQKHFFFSLNYAPGLLKEMQAVSKELTYKDNRIMMCLSKEYEWMLKDKTNVKFFNSFLERFGRIGQLLSIPSFVFQILKIFIQQRPKSCIIYNISIYNSFIFIICVFFRVKRRVLVLHEPYKEKILVQGFFVKLYFYLAELIQSMPISLSTHVILMSPNGKKIFQSRFKKYSGIITGSHLIVPDLLDLKTTIKKRKFYTVVGRFNQIKKIDYFFDFVAWSVKQGYKKDFLVVTSSNISKQINTLSYSVRQHITIINPKQLSDNAIHDALIKSKAVLLLQPVITQSGVLPFSYMSGTPVISLNNPGFTQYVKNKHNGLLVDDPRDFKNIQRSIEFVDCNLETLSREARKTYMLFFHPKNVQNLLKSII